MELVLLFLVLGLGAGAVYASLGMALVFTYRSSGVVNFSTGAVALYVAYTYAYLRQGQLLDPIPGTPVTVGIGGDLGLLPAMVVALVVAAVLGAVLYGLVFRPLRQAPPTARAVASIGLLVLIQALLAARVGTSPVVVTSILPQHVYQLGSVHIPGDRVWFAVITVLLAVVAQLFFRHTRFGLATRAAAESEKGALVTGLSPERLALSNWALSSVVAGVSGILIAPIVPLAPVSYSLFIVPALAAALVGGFSSVTLCVAAGLLIGMLQSEMTHLQTLWSWLPSGSGDLIPLIVIFGYLVLRGQSLPTRGSIVRQTLGRAPRPRYVVPATAVGLVLAVVGLLALTGDYRAALITSLVFMVLALSQVVVTGFAGQISLAQLSLAGVSAFALTRLQNQAHIPFPWAPLIAAVVAMLFGVALGLPALRIRGLPVAVITLAIAVAVSSVWFTNQSLDGGFTGAPIHPPKLFGLDLGIGVGAAFPRLDFGWLALVVVAVVGVGVALLRRSRLGASMLAVRANERSAAAAGINIAGTKLLAFAIGGFIAGLGGALLGYEQLGATSASFAPLVGVSVFATAYLAGVTSVSGGLVAGLITPGGVVYTLLSKEAHLGNWYDSISAVLLVLAVIRSPEGIVGPAHLLVGRLRSRRASDVLPAAASVKGAARIRPVDTGIVLQARGMGVRYGGVTAVSDVDLDVEGGMIVGLVGPNGAGKTTLIDALSGYARCTGTVALADDRVDGLSAHRRSRRGLGRTFQGIELYDDLSVRENVEVGTVAARRRRGEDGVPSGEQIDQLLDILELRPYVDRAVSELSQGQRQLVSVARALAGRPRVLLLDEPAAGLDSTESRWLGDRLRAVRDAGVTIVMIDHDMGLVLDLCDRVVVLDLGKVIADGTPAEVQDDPAVARAYLGSTHTAVATRAPRPKPKRVVSVVSNPSGAA